jgi:hypothetical protein
LPNNNHPKAIRWRVGRNPTCRSIALTSCQGQPVSALRSMICGAAAGSATFAKIMVRDVVMAALTVRLFHL